MTRRAAVISSLVAILVAVGAVFAGDVLAGQVATPEPGKTESTQSGYVIAPLPGGTPAAATTLEVTRLQIAAGDVLTFAHLGAAIYYVESGAIVATFDGNTGNERLFDSAVGDPNGATQLPAACDAGCPMDGGDWFSFDADLAISLTSEAGATLIISSLTPNDQQVDVITVMADGTPIVITGDSGLANP